MNKVIFEVMNAKDAKERQKLLERLREREFKDKIDNVSLLREIADLIKMGSNREKIAALQVFTRLYSGFPNEGYLKEVFGSPIEKKVEDIISYNEVLDILDNLVMLLLEDNGNLRLATSYGLSHLRTFLKIEDYAETYFDILCLRNAERDSKKIKTLEFCLDKFFSQYLDKVIESSRPIEIKKIQINFDGSEEEKERIKKVDDMVNNFVEETGVFEKEIQRMRGEKFFDLNLVGYLDGLSLFQISYELQKIDKLLKVKKDEEFLEIIDRYVKSRLLYLLKMNLGWMKKVKDKNEFFCVDIDVEGDKLVFSSLNGLYVRFDSMQDLLTKAVGGFRNGRI